MSDFALPKAPGTVMSSVFPTWTATQQINFQPRQIYTFHKTSITEQNHFLDSPRLCINCVYDVINQVYDLLIF